MATANSTDTTASEAAPKPEESGSDDEGFASFMNLLNDSSKAQGGRDEPPPPTGADGRRVDGSAAAEKVPDGDVGATVDKQHESVLDVSKDVESNVIATSGEERALVNEEGVAEDASSFDKQSRRRRIMNITSTLFFVVASVLYLVMSVIDYQWANELLTLPMEVRTADDDATWVNYRWEEHLKEQGMTVNDSVSSAFDSSVARSGGVRRMLMRKAYQRRLQEIEELHHQGGYDNGLESVANEAMIYTDGPLKEGVEKTKASTRAKSSRKRLNSKTAKAASRSAPYTTGLRRLQTPEELYYDEDWVDLPRAIQDAYTILGYTEDIWCDGGEVSTDSLDWADLSDEQREAALFIGYTEDLWCETPAPNDSAGGGDDNTPVTASPTVRPTSVPTPQPTSKPTFQPTPVPTVAPSPKPILVVPTPPPTVAPSSWPTSEQPARADPEMSVQIPTPKPVGAPFIIYQYWSSLSDDQRYALSILGYTQTLWDAGAKVGVDDDAWDDMSTAEHYGAFFLGYDRETWNEKLGVGHFANQPPKVETASPTDAPVAAPTMKPTLPLKVVTLSPTDAPVLAPSPKPTSDPATLGPTKMLSPSSPPTTAPALHVIPVPSATPEELYYDEDWADLPPAIQDAYTLLGYNETIWDEEVAVPETELLDWADLTAEQQLAAISIGYTEEIWCVTDAPTLAPVLAQVLSTTLGPTKMLSPSSPPTTAPVLPVIPLPSATPEELYYDEDWADLPPAIQDAYTLLGYNETIWDEEVAVPETELLDWADLTAEQQLAAISIGYTEEIWCVTDAPTLAPVLSNIAEPTPSADPMPPAKPTPEEMYYDEDWADLPPAIQDAYTILGYNEQMWDEEVDVAETELLDWTELTAEQQSAATFIGYTEEIWCETPSPISSPVPGFNDLPVPPTGDNPPVEQGYYDNFDWVELPRHVQDSATSLGYDQNSWDTGGVVWSDSYDWDDLPQEAKEAAFLIGYDQLSWDTDGLPGVDGLTTNALEELWNGFESDDDYIFRVGAPEEEIWVSEYQVLYFFAALLFVFVGIIDLINKRHIFHMLMILAGLFGVASAVFVEGDIYISNVLDAVSVHFFLLEGLAVFSDNRQSEMGGKWLKRFIVLGNLEFIAGAILDVIISYFFLFDSTADWDVSLMIVNIIAHVLWLHCSLIYMGAHLYEWMKLR